MMCALIKNEFMKGERDMAAFIDKLQFLRKQI